MGFQLIALAMVLIITFLHSIFGFFSGVINVFCAIVGVCVAFGFFEPLTNFVTGQFTGLSPAYVGPVVLLLLFLGTVSLLRALADSYLRRGVKLPQAVDFAGAAVCGFVVAQLYTGMLVLATLMLPLGDTVLGFSRIERVPEESNPRNRQLVAFERNDLWLRSDEMTVGLFEILSANAFRGPTEFDRVYPDFVEHVFFTTNTVQQESTPAASRSEKYGDGFERGLSVLNWWVEEDGQIRGRYVREVPTEQRRRPDYSAVELSIESGYKVVGTYLELNRSASDVSDRRAVHLFRPTQIRLVGDVRGDAVQVVPIALANADRRIDGGMRIVDIDNNFVLGEENARIYAFFEVPDEFEPRFVEYRRHARAALSGEPLEQRPQLALTYSDQPQRAAQQGPTVLELYEPGTGDNNNLPFELTGRAARGGQGAVVSGNVLESGRVSGIRERIETEFDDPEKVGYLGVPSGYRMVQIRIKPDEARTLVGDIFNFAGQLKQYTLVDNRAERYPLAGAYAIVQRGNREFFEIYYSGESPDADTAAANRSMLDFEAVERQELNQAGTVLGLLFLVDEDVVIRKFVAGNDEQDVNFRTRSGPYPNQ